MRAARSVVRRLRRDEGGYSLVELVVTIAILGTVLTAISVLFESGIHSQTDLDARFQAQVNLNTALVKLRRDAHTACGISAGNTTSLITLQLPGSGTFQPPATPCSVPALVTWCTAGSGFRWKLWRVPNTTACTTTASGARIYADYITTNAVFTSYTAESPVTGSLGRIHVRFPINPTAKSTAAGPYTLDDDVVLRNSAG